jgi:hypothetical protein
MGSERSSSRRRRRRTLLPLTVVVLLVLPLLGAWHWARLGWWDRHYNYPATPQSYAQIINRFGQPCSADAHAVWLNWTATDNGVTYKVWFHKKLGGYPTEMISDKGGRSTNLDNDVYGHIQNDHLTAYTKSGIWGYACRYIKGTTSWSTHAFGIAVDISASFEPMGTCSSSVNYHFAQIFKDHGWRWGLDFCDPMHFQYAFGY